MKKTIFAFALVLALLQGGCGIISTLGTPTRYERKIPAECDITVPANQKILVLVEQPIWINAQMNFRYYLTQQFNESFKERMKFDSERLIKYHKLSEFRSSKPNFSSLSPAEIGRSFDVDLVLVVTIADYRLTKLPESEIYKGYLAAEVSLVHADSGAKLWPQDSETKGIKVGFEFQGGEIEDSVKRLARAVAFCTTRHLYDCPVVKYKTADDKSGQAWQSW